MNEFTDPSIVSQCCAEPMYTDTDLCSSCHEQTGSVPFDEEEQQ